MLLGLQFVVAALPLELASFIAVRRWGFSPPMHKVLALWLPAAGVGMLYSFALAKTATAATMAGRCQELTLHGG